MEASLFTHIINGTIPSHRVYEDDMVYAFMDIHPIQVGQVLVVPKNPVAYVWDLPDEDYRALMWAVKQIAIRLRHVFPDKKLIAMHVEGLEVAHAHVKLFPFNTHEEFSHAPDKDTAVDHDLLKCLADQIQLS